MSKVSTQPQPKDYSAKKPRGIAMVNIDPSMHVLAQKFGQPKSTSCAENQKD